MGVASLTGRRDLVMKAMHQLATHHSEALKKLIGKLFPRRLGKLSELDGPLLLLASNAGSFMTGTVLTVDGGATILGI